MLEGKHKASTCGGLSCIPQTVTGFSRQTLCIHICHRMANHTVTDAGVTPEQRCPMHVCVPDHSHISAKKGFKRGAAAGDAGDCATD